MSMEEMSQAAGGVMPQSSQDTIAALQDLTAKTLSGARLPRCEQEVSAAMSPGVQENSQNGAELIAADCVMAKTPRRRWLEPSPPVVTAAAEGESGQTGSAFKPDGGSFTGDVDSRGCLPSRPQHQGELAAEIRWLQVQRCKEVWVRRFMLTGHGMHVINSYVSCFDFPQIYSPETYATC